MSGPGGGEAAARPGRPAYALGSSPAEAGRLRRQSAELAGHSATLLDRAGLSPGQAAADLGCGPSGILSLLAGRVGPAGRVTGLEINPASVALAREFAAEHGLVNVEVVQGDARTEIGVEATADIYPPGHPRRTIRMDLVRSMRPRILERGLAGERELEELDRAAREHLDDPETLVLPHLLFLTWGRQPLA